jgi:hypothetical protein
VQEVRLNEESQTIDHIDHEIKQREFAALAERAVFNWLVPQFGPAVQRPKNHAVDFTVRRPHGTLAFDVKSITRPALVRSRLQRWFQLLPQKAAAYAELHLIVVCEDIRLVETTERVVDQLPMRPPIKAIVVGLLNDGGFDERFRLSLPNISSP